MQKYTDTFCTTQQQMNLTTSLLHDIPTFDGWDTTKLEDWLSDTEMATNILKESCACPAKTKSCGLIWTLVHEALQAWKYWDSIRDILHLKLCNVNIHTYKSHFTETKQRDNETLTAYVDCFKTEAKRCYFNSNTATICVIVKGMHTTSWQRSMKGPPYLFGGNQISGEAQHDTTGYSFLHISYCQYNVKWWQMFCM